MTNLEYYKDELKRYIKKNPKFLSLKSDVIGKAFTLFSHERIDIWCNDEWAETEHFIDWLLEEHKEPIKLKQWEFELIGYIYRTSSVKKMFFVHYSELNYLRGVGYFKGITNEYMALKEILENCEVEYE